MALDPQIHADINEGDWKEALNHATYHLPLVGAGHHAWDAAQEGKPWHAAGYAGLGGLEAAGLRATALKGAAKRVDAGKVRGGDMSVKYLR